MNIFGLLKKKSKSGEAEAGFKLLLSKQYKEAAQCFEQAVRREPLRADLRNALAVCYAKIGKIEDAVAQAYEAIRLNPSVAEYHQNLATFLENKKDYYLAIRHYSMVLKLKHDEKQENYATGHIKSIQSIISYMVQMYEESLQREPESLPALIGLVAHYPLIGKMEEATNCLNKLLRIRDSSSDENLKFIINEEVLSEFMRRYTKAQ